MNKISYACGILVTCIIVILIVFNNQPQRVDAGIFGNQQIWDMNYTFNYAYVDYGDHSVKEPIEKWREYEDGSGDAIQVVTKDGRVIYGHRTDIILTYEP